jgi:hypothetical protein
MVGKVRQIQLVAVVQLVGLELSALHPFGVLHESQRIES